MATSELPQTLDQIWSKARSDFLKETGKDIGEKSGQMGGILKQLEAINTPIEESENVKRAKQVVGDVLKIVELLGGLACQGAAMMFSPAGMCFNAVSFLIDGVKRIKKLHADLASMFEAIKSFLIHFHMLQRIEGQFNAIDLEKLPPELILSTNKLMCCFINLCRYCYKDMIRGKFKRAMVDLRVAFADDDGGVRGELVNFKKLIDQQDSIKGSITLEEVMKSRVDIKELLQKASEDHMMNLRTHEDVAEMKNDMLAKNNKMQTEDRLNRIRGKLGLGLGRKRDHAHEKQQDSLLDKQQDLFEGFKRTRLPQSGNWLGKDEIYTAWRESSYQAGPVLFLSGKKGTGKTMLATRIVDDWKNDDPNERRVAVAYYFFGDREERRDAGERDDAADGKKAFSTAICCMAYMLALANPKYAQDLDAITSKEWKDEAELRGFSCEDLWEKLQLSADRPTSFVLIFDGLDNLSNYEEWIRLLCKVSQNNSQKSGDTGLDSRAPLSARPSAPGVRTLITINEDNLDVDLKGRVPAIRLVSTKEDRSPNVSDIDQFIDEMIGDESSQLAELAKDPQNAKLFEEFRKKLHQISAGQYSIIQSRIGLVNQKIEGELDHIEGLKQVMLSDKVNDQAEFARKVLEDLELSLKPREIDQINDILVWLVWSMGDDLSAEQVDAVAFINKASNTSLQSFSRKLNKREYRKLFKKYATEDGYSIAVHSDPYDYLRAMEWAPESQELSNQGPVKPKISLSITIEQAEPKAVKRFLWDLHEKISYDRSFFTSPTSEVQAIGRIRVNEVDATSTLIMQCLDILNGDQESSSEALMGHAVRWLPNYIWRANRIETERRSGSSSFFFPDKKPIISKFLAFLSSDNNMRHLSINWEAVPKETWFDEANVKAMNSWLNETIADKLEVEQKQVLKTLLKSCQGSVAYLYPLARNMAKRWLREDGWVTYTTCFSWIDGFLTLRKEYPIKPTKSKNGSVGATSGKDNKKTDEKYSSDGDSDRKEEEKEESEYRLPSEKERIAQAAEWAWMALNLEDKDKDSRYYEGLGMAYDIFDYVPECIRCIEQALSKAKEPGRLHRWLARLYDAPATRDEAIFHAREGLRYPPADIEGEEEIAKWSRNQKRRLASLYSNAKRYEECVDLLDETIQEDQYDYESHCDLLEATWKHEKVEKAQHYLDLLNNAPCKKSEKEEKQLSSLAELIVTTIEQYEGFWYRFEFFFSLAEQVGRSSMVFKALDDAIVYAERADKDASTLALFHAYRGYAIAVSNRDIEGHAKALDSWQKALSLLAKSKQEWIINYTKGKYLYFCSNYYLTLLKTTDGATERATRKIKELMEEGALCPRNPSRNLLAYCYATTGHMDKAKKILRKDVEDALELLIDNDPTNDWEAYEKFARVFANINDVQNALAAWSLVTPDVNKYDEEMKQFKATSESTKEVVSDARADTNSVNGSQETDSKAEAADAKTLTAAATKDIVHAVRVTTTSSDIAIVSQPKLAGKMGRYCDGGCDTNWTYANDLWRCLVCDSIDLCSTCHGKLVEDRLPVWPCNKLHDFLHVPVWSREEYEKVGKDRVRIPRNIDGEGWSREDGEIIDVVQWTDRIREEWNIEKPMKVTEPPPTIAVTNDDEDVFDLKPLSETRRRTFTIGL